MSVNQEENKSLSGIMERALNKESIKIMELEDKGELGRREAFVDPKIRDLLRKLLLVGDKEGIIPVYVPSSGFVYQVTDNPTSENETNNISRDFLESLVELIYYKRVFMTQSRYVQTANQQSLRCIIDAQNAAAIMSTKQV